MFGKFLRPAPHLVYRGVVGFDRLWKRGKSRGAGLEGTTAFQGIRFICNPTASDRLTVQTIALVVVHRHDRRIDGNLVEIRTAQAGDLCVYVRMNATVQQRIITEVDAWHDMRGAKSHLLGLGEEI